MRFLGFISVLSALVFFQACSGPQPAQPKKKPAAPAGVVEKILKVTPRDQEMYYSCWATCGEMVMDFVGQRRVRQCQQARKEFPTACPTTCCDALLNMNMCCSVPGLPQWGDWGFLSTTNAKSGTPLSWTEIKSEIDAGRPIAFTWTTADASHMMTIIGYATDSGLRILEVLDPDYGSATAQVDVAYADYRQAHWLDNYKIAVNPAGPPGGPN